MLFSIYLNLFTFYYFWLKNISRCSNNYVLYYLHGLNFFYTSYKLQ